MARTPYGVPLSWIIRDGISNPCGAIEKLQGSVRKLRQQAPTRGVPLSFDIITSEPVLEPLLHRFGRPASARQSGDDHVNQLRVTASAADPGEAGPPLGISVVSRDYVFAG